MTGCPRRTGGRDCLRLTLVLGGILNGALTYKFPVRFVFTEAEVKAGHAVEPWSDTQLCWAIVEGSAAASTVRRAARFVSRRVCF